MSGATFTARFDDAQARRALTALAAFGQDRVVLGAVGVALARNTRQRFDQEEDPDGQRWVALNPGYAPLKRGAGILRESGMRGGLQGSITSAVQGRAVVIGTNKIYGAVHQFSGVIAAKGPGGLFFRMAGGFVHARSVKIPARPYLGFSARDADTVREVLYDGLERATMH